MKFHVVCQWQMMGEFEDSDGVLTKVYRCALCGRTTERKSVFDRAVKELEEREAVADGSLGFALPDGTVTLRPREESRWRPSTSCWGPRSEGSQAR